MTPPRDSISCLPTKRFVSSTSRSKEHSQGWILREDHGVVVIVVHETPVNNERHCGGKESVPRWPQRTGDACVQLRRRDSQVTKPTIQPKNKLIGASLKGKDMHGGPFLAIAVSVCSVADAPGSKAGSTLDATILPPSWIGVAARLCQSFSLGGCRVNVETIPAFAIVIEFL